MHPHGCFAFNTTWLVLAPHSHSHQPLLTRSRHDDVVRNCADHALAVAFRVQLRPVVLAVTTRVLHHKVIYHLGYPIQ